MRRLRKLTRERGERGVISSEFLGCFPRRGEKTNSRKNLFWQRRGEKSGEGGGKKFWVCYNCGCGFLALGGGFRRERGGSGGNEREKKKETPLFAVWDMKNPNSWGKGRGAYIFSKSPYLRPGEGGGKNLD